MRVHGLRENASGLPTAALADEILLDGEGQVKVLFCLGGNPVLAWPDQKKAEAAMSKLELLVVFDYRMTATAQFAHYVIPPPLSLEVAGTSHKVEALKYNGVSRGYAFPWAQYTPAVVDAPPESDLMDDAGFFFRLAQQMKKLQLDWINVRGQGSQPGKPDRGIAARHVACADDRGIARTRLQEFAGPAGGSQETSPLVASGTSTSGLRRATRNAPRAWSWAIP